MEAAGRPVPSAAEIRELLNGPVDLGRVLGHVQRQRERCLDEWVDLAFGRDKKTWHQLEPEGRDVDIARLLEVRSRLAKAGFNLLDDGSEPEERDRYFDEHFRIWFPAPLEAYVGKPEVPEGLHRTFQYPAMTISEPTEREIVTLRLGHLTPEASSSSGWVLTNKSGSTPLTPVTFYGVNSRHS